MPEPTTCTCGHDRGTHDGIGNCWHLDAAGAEDCCCDRVELVAREPAALPELLVLCEQLDGLLARGYALPWRVEPRAGARVITEADLGEIGEVHSSPDAALIVAAVNALPTLTAAVRGLLADRDTLARVAER